jgi:uncharacterized membrane protein YkoI
MGVDRHVVGGSRVMMMPMRARALTFLLALAAPVVAVGANALTLQDAVAKVERETQGKVLSAETRHNGDRTVYRIKVLTRDGRVQVVEVPADEPDRRGQ